MVRRSLENFKCRGVLLLWIIVGQGSIALAVGAGVVVWTFFLSSVFSLFFFPLSETARYKLKYCLKGQLNPKESTNQPHETPKVESVVYKCHLSAVTEFVAIQS